MKLEWIYSEQAIDWAELAALYRRAPLGDKQPLDLQKVFSNSLYKCFVIESGLLVGAGRALADGADCSYICDVAVLPTHQGRGIGQSIVSHLIEQSSEHQKIILYSVPGKESFYESFGFKRMCTAMAIFENQVQAADTGLVCEY